MIDLLQLMIRSLLELNFSLAAEEKGHKYQYFFVIFELSNIDLVGGHFNSR